MFIAVPVDLHPVLVAFPLMLGSDLLATAMTESVGLLAFPSADLALLDAKAVADLVSGGAVIRVSTRVARHRGVLGGYCPDHRARGWTTSENTHTAGDILESN